MAAIPVKKSAVPAGADKTIVNNENPRPFKGSIKYSYSSWWTVGVGNATHLGLLTTVSTWQCDGFYTVGRDVITAADGSELILEWSATLNADYSQDGTWVLSGGTGRFENATGSGTLHAFATPELELIMYMTGTIIY